MAVYVTGANGFLGRALCSALLSKGQAVVRIDPSFTSNENAAKCWTQACKIEDLDVASLPEPLAIYHLACTTADPRGYQRVPVETLVGCVTSMVAVCELALRYNARVLLASSSEVYGETQVIPTPESYTGNIDNASIRACYDNGKRCMETLMADYHRQRGLNGCVARIFNTYGPGMNDTRVVASFVRRALSDMPLLIFGGQQTRSFCYVDDMVDALMRLMQSSLSPIRPVNLGGNEEVTVQQLAHVLGKILGRELPAIFSGREVRDPSRRCPDTTLAKCELGWQPKIPLEDGLRRVVAKESH